MIYWGTHCLGLSVVSEVWALVALFATPTLSSMTKGFSCRNSSHFRVFALVSSAYLCGNYVVEGFMIRAKDNFYELYSDANAKVLALPCNIPSHM